MARCRLRIAGCSIGFGGADREKSAMARAFVLFLFSGVILFSPGFDSTLRAGTPPNDECLNAVPLTLDTLYTDTTVNATGSDVSSCGTGDALDVWHAFTPDVDGQYTIDLCESSFDTTLAVYSGCDGAELVCNDDACMYGSRLSLYMTGGTTYTLRVSGFGNESGMYAINVTLDSPHNDLRENATSVFTDVPYSGSTDGATGVPETPCATDDDKDVWHLFKPSESATYTVGLCDSAFDTTLGIFDAAAATLLACDDDRCGPQSRVIVDLTKGIAYDIRVAGKGGVTGNYTLSVAKTAGPPGSAPANDTCESALPLALDTPYAGNTDGATGTAAFNCAVNDDLDVWHTFMPSFSGFYEISLCGSDFDTTLSVLNGCGDDELACNDDACGKQSEVFLRMTAGTPYYIRVSGYNNATGSYTIAIREVNCLPETPRDPSPQDKTGGLLPRPMLTWNLIAEKTVKTLPSPKLIYGTDDRRDEYQISDAEWKRLGDATVAMVKRSSLTDNGDDTYTLNTSPLNQVKNLCPSEPYGDQPQGSDCSGFLVATDMIATAGHCIDETDYDQYAFVFGFVMEDADTAALTFPRSQVYFAQNVIKQVLSDPGGEDYALVRLDRGVPDHTPLAVRRTGKIADSAPLLVIGHPVGLPRKYADTAAVVANTEEMYFTADTDTYGGNSGSAVFNASTLDVEGILVRGQPDFEWTPENCQVSIVCPAYDPDNFGCDGEDATRITRLAYMLPVYDVYLGQSPETMTLVCRDTTAFQCDPGALLPGTAYMWQVIAKSDCGDAPGPVWTFTTGDIRLDLVVEILRILAGFPSSFAYDGIDLAADGRVDLSEAIYMMQYLADLRL